MKKLRLRALALLLKNVFSFLHSNSISNESHDVKFDYFFFIIFLYQFKNLETATHTGPVPY